MTVIGKLGALILALSLAMPAIADPAGPQSSQVVSPDSLRFKLENPGAPVFSAACCKTCRKGKACGNSCISASKACHVGQGCACDR
ncbi:hypothetical protein [Tropicibacter sp. S64]|uniref:hypothetical protein n=1 Tax=Tropicibacter sp. S64 TaxID=3415122 RepID=UPI003C7DDA8B